MKIINISKKIVIVFFLQLIAITCLYSQNLLFKSGFESDVIIEPAIPINGQWRQVISGVDLSTGYKWPQDFPTRDTLDAYWTYKVPDTEILSDYVETRIEKTIGHDGDSTNALFMMIKDYDPTNFDNSMAGHVRCEYRLNLDTNINKAYIKYWIKLQNNFYDIMQFGTGRWRMIMEWFESGKTHSDYRWSLYLRTGRAYSDSNSAHWRIANEFQNGPGNPGDFVTDTLVNYQGVASVNEWFQIEVYWNQQPNSEGRIWIAVNGHTIIDKYGSNMRDSHIQNWQIFKLYTDEPSMDDGDVYHWIDDVEIWDDFPPVTSVNDNKPQPNTFQLMQNYPNPFNPTTTITFTIPSVGQSDASTYNTKLIIYDILGREIKTLLNKNLLPGSYELEFYGGDLSSGIYFYKILTGAYNETKKMILLK